MISVLLVDDHAMVRSGFRRLLELEPDIVVSGESGSGEEGYHDYLKLHPDIVVLDLSMKGEHGLSTLRRLLAKDPDARILIMSMHEDNVFVTGALKAGAKGYVSKASDPSELIQAVRQIGKGGKWIEPRLAQNVVLIGNSGSPVDVLSARELEVFCLLAQGRNVTEIAETLHIRGKTASAHRGNIMKKLSLQNNADITLLAIRCSLITV